MTTPEDPNQSDPRRERRDGRPEGEGAGRERPSSASEGAPGEPEETPVWPPEPPEPFPGEEPPGQPISTPGEPSLPRHPDVPTAPEVPPPVQAEPEATVGFGAPAAPEGSEPPAQPAYPMPGSTPPAYPGWEGAPETRSTEEPVVPDGQETLSSAARPSRYDPPTPPPSPSSSTPESSPTPPEGFPATAPQPGQGVPGAGPYGGQGHTGAHAAGTGQPDEGGRPPYTPPSGPSPSPGEPEQGQAPPYGQAYPSQQGQPYQAPLSPGGPGYPGGPGHPGVPPYPARPGEQWEERRQGGGLGTAALVLGIASIFLLVVCGLGVLTAVIGLILGIVAVARNSNRGRAWVGIVLSALTLIIAVVVLSWFYSKVGDCMNLPPELQQRCVEERLGVQIQTTP